MMKSWRTSLCAVLCWGVAAILVHRNCQEHLYRWRLIVDNPQFWGAPVALLVSGFGHWHAKDKKAK